MNETINLNGNLDATLNSDFLLIEQIHTIPPSIERVRLNYKEANALREWLNQHCGELKKSVDKAE